MPNKITTSLACLLFCIASLNVQSQYFATTYAGNANGNAGTKNGNIDTASFNSPFGMCMDKWGNIYIADGGSNWIRKISTKGVVSTYAGTGAPGHTNGANNVAEFNDPSDLCADDSGNIYVSDFGNQLIRKIKVTGGVITIAGNSTEGYRNGAALGAEFDYPRGICIDAHRNIYVGDSWNHRIRKIDTTGNVTTYAGGGTSMGVGSTGALLNAKDTNARFYTPAGLSIDKKGNLYVADAYNHRIRKIDTGRNVTTLCGTGGTGPGNGGYLNGSSTTAILNTPTEVFCDTAGTVLIGDTYNNMVRKADISGNVSLIAGDITPGFVNGNTAVARFSDTRGIVCNVAADSIYVIDFNNNAVRLIQPGYEGIEEYLAPANSITVYPNPSKGVFTFEINNEKLIMNNTVEIYNMLGEKVYSSQFVIRNSQFVINLSGNAKGVYLYRVISKTGEPVSSGKLLIE